jgi:thioesterase domain-containing protein
VRRVQPEGPYLLAGWSLGGTLAFEMALQLQEEGAEVPLIVFVASTPPSADHIEVAREVMADYAPWRISYMFARAICLSTGADVRLSLDEFRDQPAAVAYRLVAERLDGVGPVAAGTSTAEIERWIQVFRATLRGFHQYAPRARYRGKALVLRPSAVNPFLTRDPFVTRQAPPGDWRDHIDGAVDFQSVGGDHYGLMSRPWVAEVVDRMSRWLEAGRNHEEKVHG